MSNSAAVTVVNNTMLRSRDKRTNEIEQIDFIANAQVVEDNQILPMNVVTSPKNSPEPGLVEKLMQQLNDLKEMVYILTIGITNLYVYNLYIFKEYVPRVFGPIEEYGVYVWTWNVSALW